MYCPFSQTFVEVGRYFFLLLFSLTDHLSLKRKEKARPKTGSEGFFLILHLLFFFFVVVLFTHFEELVHSIFIYLFKKHNVTLNFLSLIHLGKYKVNFIFVFCLGGGGGGVGRPYYYNYKNIIATTLLSLPQHEA